MIRSFRGALAELILQQRRVPKGFPTDIAKVARRKLVQLDGAVLLGDLAAPPGIAWKRCGEISRGSIRSA
jgi:proteic killer suppression protein